MATNGGKRLERLETKLEAIQGKSRRHHFMLITPGETIDAKLIALHDAGLINEGDDVQPIELAWCPKRLEGKAAIPEGNNADPLADPWLISGTSETETESGMAAGPSDSRLDPPPETLARWRKHEQDIEAKGQRYQGPTMRTPGIY